MEKISWAKHVKHEEVLQMHAAVIKHISTPEDGHVNVRNM